MVLHVNDVLAHAMHHAMAHQEGAFSCTASQHAPVLQVVLHVGMVLAGIMRGASSRAIA